jgi:hypothetical protein
VPHNSINTQFSSFLQSFQASSSQLSQYKQVKQGISALGSALSSGNLSGAKSALSTLQQLLGSSATGSSQGFSNPMQAALTQLSQSLNSGNISAAQSTFNQIQQTMQSRISKYSSELGDSSVPGAVLNSASPLLDGGTFSITA